VPISLSKVDGRIVGKMRLACDRYKIHLQLAIVITRNGGGAGTWYKTVNCYDTDVCSGTLSVPDVSGSQTYWVGNEPTIGGTFVENKEDSRLYCSGGDYVGMYCGSARQAF
jgi:hypothetical protein